MWTFNIEIKFRTNQLRISNSYTHSKHMTKYKNIFEFQIFYACSKTYENRTNTNRINIIF